MPGQPAAGSEQLRALNAEAVPGGAGRRERRESRESAGELWRRGEGVSRGKRKVHLCTNKEGADVIKREGPR